MILLDLDILTTFAVLFGFFITHSHVSLSLVSVFGVLLQLSLNFPRIFLILY